MFLPSIAPLRWFLGIVLFLEAGLRFWFMYRRHKVLGGRFEKPSLPDLLWIIGGGGIHYLSIGLFVFVPESVEFAQLRYIPALASAGCVLVCGGLLLLLWSQRALGLAFCISAAPTSGHSLVTAGPYRWVRHPIYLALLLKAAGTALASSNLVVIVVAVALLIGMLIRIPVEERHLRKAYGEGWETYAARTGALFPRTLLPAGARGQSSRS